MQFNPMQCAALCGAAPRSAIPCRGCASRLPAASQNQLGRVKAICDLARLASEVYCIIIIINITNLINCYSFHFSFQYVIKRGFLEIKCLYTCTEIHTLDEKMLRTTHDFMQRAVPSQP